MFPARPTSPAAKVGDDCRAQGIAVSVSGILICAVAIARDWPIFATRPDFKSYARIPAQIAHTAEAAGYM